MINKINIDFNSNQISYNLNIESQKPSSFTEKIKNYFGITSQSLIIQTISGVLK
jgi:hypothetical protein